MKGLSQAIGSAIGAAIGGRFGNSSLGGMAGSQLGNAFSKVTGLGDYKINGNSLMSNNVPNLKNHKGNVRISHREYISDIIGSTTFTDNQFQIQPSNANLFPWLSQIAPNFQQYKMHGLLFDFVSTSANALNSTNTALGQLILTTNYNPSAPAYLNLQEALNTEYSTCCKPSESCLHMIECDPKQTYNNGFFYIQQDGVVPVGQDILHYNMGLFQLITNGMQAAANIGQLWVTYDIELVKPVLNDMDDSTPQAKYQLVSPLVTTAYLGSSVVKVFDNLGCIITPTTLVIPNINPGTILLISYSVHGTVNAVSMPALTITNGTLLTQWRNNSLMQQNNTSTTSVTLLSNFFVQNQSNLGDSQNVTIVFSGGALPLAGDYGDLVITQMSEFI